MFKQVTSIICICLISTSFSTRDISLKQSISYNIVLDGKAKNNVHEELSLQLGITHFTTRPIFPSLNIYNLKIYEQLSPEEIELALRNCKLIGHFEKDLETSLRATTPNDTDYSEQWNMEFINASQAWDITTGGTTSSGHDIVVAVIDDGFDFEHEDLVDNIWINEAEIPNNRIDDDNNGYIDDYVGVNIRTGDGTLPKRTHGTSVAGIIGATGDNGTGIAGINWNVKVMLIAGQAFVSDIIEGYNYILTQRKLYNNTNGEEGAFVVVSNFSSGINEAFAEDFPVWCAVYDELGKAGILSIGATANNAVDVDVVGDMPGTCPSEFLIIANNVTQENILARDSGFGKSYVDLAAPGEDAFTLRNQNSYGTFSGTSSSAPHVAGAIALMYATPRSELDKLERLNPDRAALAIKKALLNSTRKLDILSNKNSSGGILDLGNAMTAVDQLFEAESSLAFNISPNPTISELSIDFLSPENQDYSIAIHNSSGALLYNKAFSSTTFDFINHTIDVTPLISGIYFVSLISADKTLTKRLVIY